ncbi:hypothetical protein LBSG162_07790 [Lentilactobacillus buchneri subsp. silagei]|nr:hypothetical protein Ltb232_19660 [Lentilactobacillus buchneri subsp. silagei]GED91674.1 hypothetical protein LBSG162_07790 [Lentilactobacillus buchneri subsp. silagei]GED94474.1 hypothetical protein LBSP_10340 [Lentilactobacillus buchneri subsp. silagei]
MNFERKMIGFDLSTICGVVSAFAMLFSSLNNGELLYKEMLHHEVIVIGFS